MFFRVIQYEATIFKAFLHKIKILRWLIHFLTLFIPLENIGKPKDFQFFRGYRKRLVAWNGLTLSWRRSLSHRNQSMICFVNHWTAFYMIGTSVIKELRTLQNLSLCYREDRKQCAREIYLISEWKQISTIYVAHTGPFSCFSQLLWNIGDEASRQAAEQTSIVYYWGGRVNKPTILLCPTIGQFITQVCVGRTKKLGLTSNGRVLLWEVWLLLIYFRPTSLKTRVRHHTFSTGLHRILDEIEQHRTFCPVNI